MILLKTLTKHLRLFQNKILTGHFIVIIENLVLSYKNICDNMYSNIEKTLTERVVYLSHTERITSAESIP